MKTLTFTIAAMLIAAPLCFASTAGLSPTPLTDAGPAGVHPAEMSLPGVVAEVNLAMGSAADAKPKIVQAEVKRLHPSQLSLEGELVEDVLAPDVRKVMADDLLAASR